MAETQEDHTMRFFFPQVMKFILEIAGLQIIHSGPFPDYNEDLNEMTWNMIVFAQKR